MKTQFIQSAAKPWPAGTDARQRGFTLIELIMVMVMLGVLAVFAAPRIFNSDDFYARGFHDETLALLRYAQKTAIAQRRTVCVSFNSTSAPYSVSLTMAATAAVTNCTTPTPLTGPNGTPTVRARSGIAYNATPTDFNFDGLGQPITSAGAAVPTQNIQIVNATAVTVETSTGYVHD